MVEISLILAGITALLIFATFSLHFWPSIIAWVITGLMLRVYGGPKTIKRCRVHEYMEDCSTGCKELHHYNESNRDYHPERAGIASVIALIVTILNIIWVITYSGH